MARLYFFVDGLNLYHALDYLEGSDHRRLQKFKWISLSKLAECYRVDKKDVIVGVEWFTTLVTWDAGKLARHRTLVKAQENDGVVVTFGEFKRKHLRCKGTCKESFTTVEEKQTDVNIALRLYQLAVQDVYDKAIIISGDTDLLAAVKFVRKDYPGKQIGVVIPIGKRSEDFKNQADFHYKMKEKHLTTSRYDDNVTLKDNSVISCPPSWR
jgi:uncharacterized LabA/DUF88 family protein